MSRVCQISGKGPLKGHRRRHPHSGAWNLRAPKKNHTFLPNLQTVTVNTPDGKVRLTRQGERFMNFSRLVARLFGTDRRFVSGGSGPAPHRAAH